MSFLAVRMGVPGFRMGQVHPRLVQDRGYKVWVPWDSNVGPERRTLWTFTLTSA